MIVVITALYRLENLPKLQEMMKPYLRTWDYYWLIIADGSLKGKIETGLWPQMRIIQSPFSNAIGGHANRNYALCETHKNHFATNPWIYFLDDDNKLHKDLGDTLNNCPDDFDVLIFDQLVRRKRCRFLKRVRRVTSLLNVRVGLIDTGMFAFRYNALKGLRFMEDFNEADGVFIQQLIARNNVAIINKTLSYYNWLR